MSRKNRTGRGGWVHCQAGKARLCLRPAVEWSWLALGGIFLSSFVRTGWEKSSHLVGSPFLQHWLKLCLEVQSRDFIVNTNNEHTLLGTFTYIHVPDTSQRSLFHCYFQPLLSTGWLAPPLSDLQVYYIMNHTVLYNKKCTGKHVFQQYTLVQSGKVIPDEE